MNDSLPTQGQEAAVTSLSTLQLHTGGLFDGATVDGLVHLVRRRDNGSTPGPSLCGFDRFGESCGFSVGGGLSTVREPCAACARVAADEFPGHVIYGMNAGPIAALVGTKADQ